MVTALSGDELEKSHILKVGQRHPDDTRAASGASYPTRSGFPPNCNGGNIANCLSDNDIDIAIGNITSYPAATFYNHEQ